MAPSPSTTYSTSTPPTGPRIPPTGPKALRNVNGTNKQPPSGPAALVNGNLLNTKHDRISFSFPQAHSSPNISASSSEAGPSRIRLNSQESKVNSPSSLLNGSSTSTSSLNGSAVGDTSKTSSLISPKTPFKIDIPSAPSPDRNALHCLPKSSSSSSSSTAGAFSKTTTTNESNQQQSRKVPTSPKKRHTKSLSEDKNKVDNDNSYRSYFLPVDESQRAKVSISFSLPANTNGSIRRPKPPHLDAKLPFEISPAGTPPPPPPPPPPSSSQPPPPPSPPPFDARPLTPPLPPHGRPPTPSQDDILKPPTPPPPSDKDDDLPPPPPSPPIHSSSPFPPPPPPKPRPPSAPRSFFASSSPISISLTSTSSTPKPISQPPPPPPPSNNDTPPSPPPIEPPSPPPPAPPSPGPSMPPLAPPSFHFRDLSIRQKEPHEEDEQDQKDADLSIEPPLSKSPPAPLSRAPTPPYIPPPYVAPACVRPRPGTGNFLVFKEGKEGKESKRYDGIENGEAIEVSDPRRKISKDQLQKGKGSTKCRSGYYEIEYEWDENSTGPKPPPPPTAVLITGLSALTTTDQISKSLRPYGRIKDIDAKMDTKSGMQLGICWVKFDGPPHGKTGTAHDVACQVVKVCDGQRISLNGNEKIKVVLDGRGLRTERAVKDEMLRRYPPKPKVIPKPVVSVSTPSLIQPTAAGTSTPSSAGAQTPRATNESSVSRIIPPIPKPLTGSLPNRPHRTPQSYQQNPPYEPSLHVSLPSRPTTMLSRSAASSSTMLLARPSGLPVRPDTTVQNLVSSFTAAPFSRHTSGSDYDRGRRYDYSDSYTPDSRRPRSRSRSRTPYSDYSSDYSSDSVDYHSRPSYRPRDRSPHRGRRPNGKTAPQFKPTIEDEKAVERIKQASSSNGLKHIFIDSSSLSPTESNSSYVKDHFKTFKPSQILHNHHGWYILFSNNFTADRAQVVLNGTTIQGHRLALSVKSPPSASIATANKKPDEEENQAVMGNNKVEKGAWKFLTITKKSKSAPIPTEPKADRTKVENLRKKIMESDESSDDEEKVVHVKPKKRIPSFSSTSSLSDNETVPPVKTTKLSNKKDDMAMDIVEDSISPAPPIEEVVTVIEEQKENGIQTTKGKKRPGKAKVSKKSKKARLDSPVPTVEPIVEILPSPEPEVAEIIPEKEAEHEIEVAKVVKKATGKKKGPKSEFDKFIASTILDEEDAYWLGKALSAAKEGEEPEFDADASEIGQEKNKDESLSDKKHPLYHTSGSWRAEGFKKIAQISKSEYLPQRNKATTSATISEEAAAANTGQGITTGRTARLAGRDQNRHVTAFNNSSTGGGNTTDSELFAFNQLRIRKKQLKFARSAIEGYGLYAMEIIQKGEMVCEYVGELVRAAIADVREQRYMKQGIGSSYLFRIDNDVVCDATFRGSVSRLINHSCDPSANAKIIKVNGQSKIVIYAERSLYPGEEILYDYKFPLESDPALRVQCLCGAATCRGWLN
ncbi:uncharacterized protein L201_003538 [Kwoniella dendrophila CBS 6074]|uniref:Histone-lysine N-methyltransferase, H3 lysine-4 specific n=1 Tax=Kwoniella dendrophila CBS 6074 TaxID=1295534 RepID=A0AAX4JVR7_9TREE